jgi:GTP-binding protein
LLHLVDVSDASGRPDPVEDFKVINKELASFTSKAANTEPDPFSDDADQPSGPIHPLANKTMIVCATKIDSVNPEKLKKLAAHVKRKRLEFHAISAVTGQGIEELKWSLARHLRPRAEFKDYLLGGPKVDNFEVVRSRDTGRKIDL